jgi:predicted dithiol-disulfide oxidoreductase (DUF899 family)
MVRVDKSYVFDTSEGKKSLRDLFGSSPQLIVYHFMFEPAWEDGCKSCSFLADGFDGSSKHLPARDTAFVAISRAPLEKLLAFRKRMGWTFPWASSHGTDFNVDFGVSFRKEDAVDGKQLYNYARTKEGEMDMPGASTFLREGDDVFHTYSTYARGLDMLVGTYNWLDITPLGRHEEDLPWSMAWVRLHDRY